MTHDDYTRNLSSHIELLDLLDDEFLQAGGQDVIHVGVLADLLRTAAERAVSDGAL